MMGRKNNLFPILLVAVFLVAVFVIYPGPELVITQEYLVLLPSVLLIAISIYAVKNTRGVNQVFACALLGVGFAVLAGELDAINVWIPDILTPTLTLQYLQALIIGLATIVGVAMSR